MPNTTNQPDTDQPTPAPRLADHQPSATLRIRHAADPARAAKREARREATRQPKRGEPGYVYPEHRTAMDPARFLRVAEAWGREVAGVFLNRRQRREAGAR